MAKRERQGAEDIDIPAKRLKPPNEEDKGEAQAEEVAQLTKASLLGIPTELRDQIIYEALLNYGPDGPLYGPEGISEEDHMQPGLTRACRQLRDESLSIFLGRRNDWCITIYDYKLEPQPEHWVWRHSPSLTCYPDTGDSRSKFSSSGCDSTMRAVQGLDRKLRTHRK